MKKIFLTIGLFGLLGFTMNSCQKCTKCSYTYYDDASSTDVPREEEVCASGEDNSLEDDFEEEAAEQDSIVNPVSCSKS